LYSSASKGLSASQLSRWIDVNYKTAFTILHKLRESITRSADKSPVSGTIHIDGGHFGGKPRSGQFRNKAKPEAIAEKIKLGKSQGARRSRMSRANYERRKRNRRIVMVIRQLGEMGKGALRTIVEVAHGETEKVVKSLTERYVTPGSLIQTDESPAYHSCCLRYRHEAVQHSTEYSTIDGVNNNQAESYFSRLRRFEYGVSHRMEAKYMRDYASEMAWREDFRRKSEFNRFKDIVERIMLNGLSRWWCGYWQGVKRESEMLWEA
ncbi:MAG: IS1595 family transposase, partial [Chloroflexi bacterium]|nr:IS1595 family transposase [Chloroflexota bacterium]